MHSTDTTPSRAGKVTRRTVAAGAVWTVPAVILATPASATVISGVIHYHIVTSGASGTSPINVTVTVHNGLSSVVNVSAISLTGFGPGGSIATVRNSPTTLPVAIPANNGTQDFTFTITRKNGVDIGDPGANITSDAPGGIGKDPGPV